MRAYRFLRPGAVERFTHAAWPAPGAWSAAPVEAVPVDELPLWIADELWEVELRDPVRAAPGGLAAASGRLLARVDGWDAAAAHGFRDDCAARVRQAGYAEDVESYCCGPDAVRNAALAAMIAAVAADRAGRAAEERAAQAAWFRALV